MTCPACQADNNPSAAACVRCGVALAAPTEVVVTVDLSPGTLFHGRYRILGPLGRGGMGMVYKAHDQTLDETVAIKILRPDFAQDKTMAERFKSEIKLARKVRHRNVCAIHDFGEERGLLFISMEFIEGMDLKHVLREKGGLAPNDAYDLAIQVAEGLAAVHDAGIIHRDLKTPNIMQDAQGVARLMDFGIAKRQDAETLTATGNIVGTPEYMSPEQGQGQKVDFRSDVYALGVVTYEMFTGHVPFRGDTPISTILKHLNEPPPLDGPRAERIPPHLKPVLRRALAKEAAARYPTVRDFAEGLRWARSPSSRQERAPTEALEAPTLPARDPARARPRWPLQAGVLVLLLVGLAAVAAMWAGSLRRRAAAPSTIPPSVPVTVAVPPSLASTPTAAGASPAPAYVAPAAGPLATTPPAGDLGHRAERKTPAGPAKSAVPSPLPAATPAPTEVPTAGPRAEAPALEAMGMLQVVARPWAEVSVDGKLIGETPLERITLAAGTHVVRLRHPAYEPIERKVTIRPGQTDRVVVDLAAEGVRRP